ncbi:MAG: uracil-DNA glycosylase [Osedax symbiont Rs2]|nr:MAG: uracil-DNA glycosylase [Osedax symbiont Rs2]
MSLPKRWKKLIQQQQQQDYFIALIDAIAQERAQGIEIYPKDKDIYNAFEYVDIDKIKVVILGQDPYHGVDQARGLAFSVSRDDKTPPSLVNIYKELQADIEAFEIPQHGDLSSWAQQGVLLLNTVLTVQRAKAHSHAKLGWELFTDAVITQISKQNPHCVFLLWGAHAQAKGENIDSQKHLVLSAVHPSPLSAYRGFFGCKHFSTANTWLVAKGAAGIDWKIEDHGSLSLF